MSRADKQRGLRLEVCNGCPRRCRYADFRAFGPYAGGFAPERKRDPKKAQERKLACKAAREAGQPLPHGNSRAARGRLHAGQALFAEASAERLAAMEKGKYNRKGGVLGSMHQLKWDMWQEYINRCPMWGTDGEVEGD